MYGQENYRHGYLRALTRVSDKGFSYFEGPGCFRLAGRLQSFGAAFGTWAELSQKSVSIQTHTVSIAPLELKGVIADELHVGSFQCGRNAAGNEPPLSREFIHALRAWTVFSQEPRRIGTEMTVIPLDVCLCGGYAFDLFRHCIWQWAGLLSGVGIRKRVPVQYDLSLCSRSLLCPDRLLPSGAGTRRAARTPPP